MEQVWAQAEGGDKLHLQKEEEEGPVSADRVVVGGAGGACRGWWNVWGNLGSFYFEAWVFFGLRSELTC